MTDSIEQVVEIVAKKDFAAQKYVMRVLGFIACKITRLDYRAMKVGVFDGSFE